MEEGKRQTILWSGDADADGTGTDEALKQAGGLTSLYVGGGVELGSNEGSAWNTKRRERSRRTYTDGCHSDGFTRSSS